VALARNVTAPGKAQPVETVVSLLADSGARGVG